MTKNPFDYLFPLFYFAYYLVNSLSDPHSGLRETLSSRFNSSSVVAFHDALQLCNGGLDCGFRIVVDLFTVLFKALFALVDCGFGVVFDLDQLFASEVGLGVGFSIADLFSFSILTFIS